MKHTIAILIAVLCLTSACRGGQTTSPQPLTQAAVDSAAIYQEKAYQAMFDNVLHQAEQHAYRAFLLSSDSAFQADALSLLCYIYYREGKEEDMQMLMQTISPGNILESQTVRSRTLSVVLNRPYAAPKADSTKRLISAFFIWTENNRHGISVSHEFSVY